MANQDEIGDVLQILHALYPHSSPMPKGLSEEKLAKAVARLVPGAGPFQVVGREGPWVQLAAYAHGDFLTEEDPDERL